MIVTLTLIVTIGVLENDDEISSKGESLLETENVVATVATHIQTRSGREHCSSPSTESQLSPPSLPRLARLGQNLIG